MKIKGSNKADDLVGTSGNDTILGLNGNDTIKVKGGSDTVNAGNGRDQVIITAGAMSSEIDLGKGNDSVEILESKQSEQSFTIDGGKGDDAVNFALDQSEYEVVENGDGAFTITDANGNSYVLTSISELTFNGALYQEPGNPINVAPVVASPIADQVVNENVPLSFQIAANAFTDADNDALTYTATLATGAALPSWLTFDAATRTFTGTPPDTTGSSVFAVSVTANDGNGGTVSDTFNLTVNDTTVSPPPPPQPTMEEQFYARYVAQDALYAQNGYYDVPTNKLGIDIALEYFKYLDDGGEAFDMLAKNTDTRHQTIHDNFLGNLTEAALTDRGLMQYALDKALELGIDISDVVKRPYYGGYDIDGAAAEYPAVAWDYDNGINRDDFASFNVTLADKSLSKNETDVGGDMYSGSGVPINDFNTAAFNAGGIRMSLKADQYGNVYADHVNGNTYTVHDGVSATNAGRADWSMYFSVEEGLNGSKQTVGNGTTKGDFDVGLWIDIDPSDGDNFKFLANIEEIPDSVTGNADVFQNSWNFGFNFIRTQLEDNYGVTFEGPAEFEIELRLTEVRSVDTIGSAATGEDVLINHINVHVIDNEAVLV